MAFTSDLRDEIERIVEQKTRFMRHYYGTVFSNIDPLAPDSGAVIALCDELGWSDPISAARVLPRFMHSMSVPNIGEAIEIYFQDGNPSKARYMAQAQDVFNNKPISYKLPTDHIVHESPILKQFIKVDDLTGTITINPAIFTKLGLGTSPMVKGTELLAYLTTLVTAIYNTHTHICAAPGLPSATPLPQGTPPSGSELSLKHFLD
jgi:hypothetical protein